VSVARVLIWNLADSKTTLEEVREQLPTRRANDVWIANDAQERLGLISLSEELPNLESLRELIGKDPEVAEEYDVL
jgi:hypothetical protein